MFLVEFLCAKKLHAFKLLGIDIVMLNDRPLLDDDNNVVFGPRMKKSKKINGN